MDTTFTGIKNLSYLKIQHANQETKIANQPLDRYVLNMQLTDDANGNDLTNFRSLLQKTGIQLRNHPINPEFLNIEIFTNSAHSESGRIIFLNRTGLKIKDDILSMMSYIGKLLKRITNMKEQEFRLDEQYCIPENLCKSTLMGQDILEILPQNLSITKQRNVIANLHSEQNVKDGTTKMFNIFQDEMLDYLS